MLTSGWEGDIVEVDPVILRSFAREATEAGQGVRDADLPGKFSRSFDGVEGSAAQWMAQQMGHLMGAPLNEFADGISAMESAVRANADTFEAEDNELAAKFNGIHVDHPLREQ